MNYSMTRGLRKILQLSASSFSLIIFPMSLECELESFVYLVFVCLERLFARADLQNDRTHVGTEHGKLQMMRLCSCQAFKTFL